VPRLFGVWGYAMNLKGRLKFIREITPLSLILLFFWFVFTEKTNWHHIVFGVVVALIFAAVSYYLTGGRLDPKLNVSVALRFPVFAVLIFWEIIKANVDVLMRVFSPSLPISPRITAFDSVLESDIAKTVLANSITLTPGTVTLEIAGSRFYVHCLAAEHEEGLLEGRLERMVAWLFREGPVEMRKLR